LLRGFGLSSVLSVVALGSVLAFLGPGAAFVALVLVAIELAFSLDNAVINAKILARLEPFWQRLFLTLGIVVAVFGVRLLLPVAIVALTAHLPLGEVVNLALHHPASYAQHLTEAHPSITAFGGAFLLALSLRFFMANRKVQWLKFVERPLSRVVNWWLPLMIVLVVIIGLAVLPFNAHPKPTFIAGFVGLLIYVLMDGFIILMDQRIGNANATPRMGWTAFATFLYLQLLDASLSFDGVIGAFAITNSVVLIAIGLGVGAVWVRSLTVYMVRRRTLDAYQYLEHGAHYAIAVLAIAMLLGNIVDVPNFPLGLICLGLIGASLVTSRQALKARNSEQEA